MQYRDDTIVESKVNDHNPQLPDNDNDHEEDTGPYTSHIYSVVNKKNKKKDDNGSNPVQLPQSVLPPVYSLATAVENDDETTV